MATENGQRERKWDTEPERPAIGYRTYKKKKKKYGN